MPQRQSPAGSQVQAKIDLKLLGSVSLVYYQLRLVVERERTGKLTSTSETQTACLSQRRVAPPTEVKTAPEPRTQTVHTNNR